MRLATPRAIILAALPLAAGCQQFSLPISEPPAASALNGAARVVARLPGSRAARVSPADVARAKVQIGWNGGQTPQIELFETSPDGFEVVVENLPTGVPCTVSVGAYDAANRLLYSGQVQGVVFDPATVIEVGINLEASDNGDGAGQAPRIVRVYRPTASIPVGMNVGLRFAVADPDADALQYTLTTSGDGAFDHPTGSIPLTAGAGELAVEYDTPTSPGQATVTLTVVDLDGLSAATTFELTLVVPPAGANEGAAWVEINFPPTIVGIHANRTPDGQGIQLTADAADDGAIDSLVFAWSAAGQTPGGNPVTITPPPGGGDITVQLTVTDVQGASTSIEFELPTDAVILDDLPLDNLPPVISAAYLSSQNVSYGDTVGLRLRVSDPNGDALTAEWSADGGSLGGSSVTSEGNFQNFSANWNADVNAGTYAVTAAIRDPDGATVSYQFTIHETLGLVPVTANAGPDQEGFINGMVLLNGSGSSSADGQIVSYHWSQISGPAATIDSPASAVTNVQLSAGGSYSFRLTVANVNDSKTDTVVITAINPFQFAFTDADMSEDGIISFLDTASGRVRRYDTATMQFLPSFALGTGAQQFAVSPDGGAIYVGYQGGRIDVIATDTGERVFFTAAPETVLRMAVVEDHVFTIDGSGAWETHSLYSRLTGVRTFAAEWRNSSNGVAYARNMRRLFTFRDGTSPNDIIRTDVNPADGTLGDDIDSPYHGDYSFSHPMRIFPDESRIAVASGVFFSTTDLTYAGSIGMSYKDLRFLGNRSYLVRASGTQTEMVVLSSNFSILGNVFFAGQPQRLYATDSALFVVTTPATGTVAINRYIPE